MPSDNCSLCGKSLCVTEDGLNEIYCSNPECSMHDGGVGDAMTRHLETGSVGGWLGVDREPDI
jgi:hypothetical protein